MLPLKKHNIKYQNMIQVPTHSSTKTLSMMIGMRGSTWGGLL